MQLNLALLDIPNPNAAVWEQLDKDQRAAALEVLVRLIAQTAQGEMNAEGNEDD